MVCYLYLPVGIELGLLGKDLPTLPVLPRSHFFFPVIKKLFLKEYLYQQKNKNKN